MKRVMNVLNAQGWGNRGYLISAGFQLMKISSLALCMDKPSQKSENWRKY